MFRWECPLRWSDMDAQGHMNNAVMVDYLQEARVVFLRQGSASALLDEGIIVVSHQVEYRRPVHYDDEPVFIELGVSKLGASRVELAYELTQGGEVALKARTMLCAFSFEEQAPIRLKDEYRAFFSDRRIQVEPLRELKAPSLEGRGTAVPLPVRWTDLDSYGHVNNAKIYDFIQQARVTATTQWDPTMARAGSKESQYMWLIARQDVDYLAQIEHRLEPYEVRVAPVHLGTSSIVLASELVDPLTGAVHNRARTILVVADNDLNKTSLPDSLRSSLEPHLVAGS
ncbi:MAG: thioesterase family protein [Propionibacteriaceae bacterium]|nr:thioesterase family protein [Propionibacteriaceae bacterium]